MIIYRLVFHLKYISSFYFNTQFLHYGFLISTLFVGEMKIQVHKVLSSSDYKKVFKLPAIAKKCDNFGKPSS